MKLAIATCMNLPEPDFDEAPLRQALRSAGVDVVMHAWDDPAATLDGADACLVRSTWNYYEDPAAFRAWIERTAAHVPLFNPAHVLLGNMHKSYLRDLASRGIPIVPSRFFTHGEQVNVHDHARSCGWTGIVIKPAVSAASFRTRRFESAASPDAQFFFDQLIADRDALIQPCMPGFAAERSLMWIDGDWTHAVVKRPRFDGEDEAVELDHPATAEERDLGNRALKGIASDILYARLDVIRDDADKPLVSELELIEPSLFFPRSAGALERFVAAIKRRIT